MNRKTNYIFVYFLLLFFVGFESGAIPQNSSFHNKELEIFWSRVEDQMNDQVSDTSYHFILQLVWEHCGHDTGCLIRTYKSVVVKLEHTFNLPAAIIMCGEMAKLSHSQNDLKSEALAYRNLSRFNSALGNMHLAVIYNEKAMDLAKKTGNKHDVMIAVMTRLEQNLDPAKSKEVLPRMDSLLAQAVKNSDTISVIYLNIRMVQIKIDAGLYEDASRHIGNLEKIPVSNPILTKEYGMLITIALGRADLAMAKNDSNSARLYLQKALQLCEAEPSRWLEVHVLQMLSELEWNCGHAALSKAYIESALRKAENLHLDDLLIPVFRMKAKIAESEGRYEDALEYSKKTRVHQNNFDSKTAGFDVQNYYLQQEKNQLANEMENQDLELKLKKTELRNSLIIVILIFLLATGLSIGLYKQRKGKRELAAQNALIREQGEKLESLDRAKSRFFANVSHELRTPLSLILGPLGSLLKENQSLEKQTKLLGIAHENGKLLEELVTEILDLAKLEMGKMELDKKPTNVYALFLGYCSHFESFAIQRKIDFSVKNLVSDNLVIYLDQGKFRQILFNLLINAFKFSSEGDRVEATLMEKDGLLQLEVTDTGQGIHPDDLPHLFDRYFQTTRLDKPAEGGTGIGLALCYEYAQLFGGKTAVESSLGKGTKFRVEFPVSLVADEQRAPDRKIKSSDSLTDIITENEINIEQVEHRELIAEHLSQAGNKPTILVVEDNLAQQEYLDHILAGKYNIVSALNGKAALGYLSQNEDCQLILSDLMMPVMDGYQLLEKLKSEDLTRHIPVIMLTGRADTGSKLTALRIGVDDYLIKPYDEDELLARIENLLKNRSARLPESQPGTKPVIYNPVFSQPDLDWLKAFENYIRTHLNDDTLSVPSLAWEFAMSESSLLRQLQRLTGLPPARYLQEMRLDKARQLIENRSCQSIAQVATEVGFSDARSFSRSFKQRFGKLPSGLLD